jgi:curli production assembly/transport component CsgE
VIAVLLLVCGFMMPAHAEVELQGLLLNQTRTFAGQLFYTAFVESWQTLDPESRYTLVISERPSARTGSQITVKYGEQVVYQQILQFNTARAQRAGQLAPAQVFDRVVSTEVEEMFTNPDMANDEIKLN